MNKKEDEHIKDDVAQLEKRCEKLELQVAEFREKLIDLENEWGKDKMRIADLELTLTTKEGGRRDFDFLSVKLMKEVMGRKRGMDYRDVRNFLDFKSDKEAYRIIDRVANNFFSSVEIRVIKNSNRSKKILCRRTKTC